MELHHGHALLGIVKGGEVVIVDSLRIGVGADLLGGEKLILQLGVAALETGDGGVALDEAGLQSLIPHLGGLGGGEEGLGSGVEYGHALLLGLGHVDLQIRQILTGCAAAVVADAPQSKGHVLVTPGLHLALDGVDRVAQVVGVDGQILKAGGVDRASVKALPLHVIGGEVEEFGHGTAADVAPIAALGEDLDKSLGVAEGVHVDGHRGDHAELLLEVGKTRLDLTDKALARGDVAVGLNVPAAHDVPLPCGHQLLDAGEQGGIVGFGELIEQGLVVAEDIVVLVGDLGGGVEGSQRGGCALVPVPLPDGIQVGVTDEVEFFHDRLLFEKEITRILYRINECLSRTS